MAGSDGSWTTAELMVSVLAGEVHDGDLLGQGLGTYLPAVAYLLAKRAHAPRACLLYSVGGCYSYHARPLGLTSLHRTALAHPIRRVSYTEIALDTMPSMRLKEFGRPAQVDRWGATNNTVIGGYDRPRVRLPGAAGIPDFSPYPGPRTILYLPRHTATAFVDQLDFRSGAGRPARQALVSGDDPQAPGDGPARIVTNLGVIAFQADGPRVASLHPGVTLEETRAATGFELSAPDTVPVTPGPSAAALDLIRSEIDPLNLRDLEFASSSDRRAMIRLILARETADTDAV